MDGPSGPRVVLILLFIFFFLVSPDTQRASPAQQREARKTIQLEHDAIEQLSTSYYGELDAAENRFVNITGLRRGDGYGWYFLPKIQERAREQANDVLNTNRVQTGYNTWRTLKVGDFGERYTSLESLDSEPDSPRIAPFYRNVTGLVRGGWVRSQIENEFLPPSPNLTAVSDVAYVTREFDRNITGSKGELRLKLDEKRSVALMTGSNVVQEVKAELTLQDKASNGEGREIILHGVHFVETGSILLSTTSEKYAGIFALAHFARSETTFSLARNLLNVTLRTSIEKQEASSAFPNLPWAASSNAASEMMFPIPHCEYVVYLQQHFVWPYQHEGNWATKLMPLKQDAGVPAPTYLSSLETELKDPSGAPLDFVPDLRFSALIFSPDCGFVLESSGSPDGWYHSPGAHLQGPKVDVFIKSIRRAVEMFSLLLCAQIFLLIRQMKDASTPSTKSRISYYTVAAMALGDGFAFLSSMVMSLFLEAAFITLIATAFLAFLCVSFFGMKFLMDIWTVQAPERQERERQRSQEQENSTPNQIRNSTPGARQVSTPAVVVTPAGADTLPAPATARRPRDTGATPVILPPDQDIEAAAADDAVAGQQATAQTTLGNARREMGAMYSKFYFLLISLIFLSLNASTWPTTIRSVDTNVVAFLYLSFWIPQIKRNIIRNCRKALRWEFVIGQSILRLIPFAYFYTYENNVLSAKSDLSTFYFFAAWQWAQILILISQEVLGPRFFIPSGWVPPAYDYHQVLREGDEEGGGGFMPIGFIQALSSTDLPAASTGESKERGKWISDCIICMHSLDAPYIPRGPDRQAGAASPALVTNIFARRDYMITPCRHIFHAHCLDGWMKYKLQCPICRESLPPL